MDAGFELPAYLAVISPLDTRLLNGAEAEGTCFSIGCDALQMCARGPLGRVPELVVGFPVGNGRFVRWFRYAWPGIRLFGVEIDEQALQFSAKVFSLASVVADALLRTTELPERTGVVFSDALLTHVDERQSDCFLALCATSLGARGVLVFPMHRGVAALLAAVDTAALGATYRQEFAFVPYAADVPTRGLSLFSPACVMRKLKAIPDLKIVGFEEQGSGKDAGVLEKNARPMVRHL